MENWRTTPGFRDYRVSRYGGVRWKHQPLVLRRDQKTGKAYVKINLGKGRRALFRHVDRLVMEAFVGKRPDGMRIEHIDGNPENDCLTNLRYMPTARGGRPRGQRGNADRVFPVEVRFVEPRRPNR